LIPDYAMKNIEPSSNFLPKPSNKDKTLYDVQTVKYATILLLNIPDLKLLTESFYWCN